MNRFYNDSMKLINTFTLSNTKNLLFWLFWNIHYCTLQSLPCATDLHSNVFCSWFFKNIMGRDKCIIQQVWLSLLTLIIRSTVANWIQNSFPNAIILYRVIDTVCNGNTPGYYFPILYTYISLISWITVQNLNSQWIF